MDDEQQKSVAKEPSADDEKLLKEIRDRYDYALAAWREAREQRQIDMRFLAGDPWDEKDRKQREDAGRPCINHDELNQYVNQYVNNLRQNPRGIKIEPAGNGADDQSAEFRQDLIRGIEYRSRAQRLVYLPAGEAAAQGGYGFLKVTRRYVSDDDFDQEIVLKGIPNPDSVLFDPDFREQDGSDARYCFELDPVPRDQFEQLYPKAQKKDFTTEDVRTAPNWVQDKVILVASYWRVTTTYDLLRRGGRTREVEKKTLTQYVTNGVEILKRIPQPGTRVPLIPVWAKILWRDKGDGPKREFISLTRLARDPQMSLAYVVTGAMEEAGMVPKASYIGYKGQFESDAEAWDECNKVPHPYLQVDPIVDAAQGQVLPIPQRVLMAPNAQAWTMMIENARRAIQAAIGILPIPTAAQTDREKSGLAIRQLQNQSAIGSFHLNDNFDMALESAAQVIEEWIPVVYDTEREVAIHKPDGKRIVAKINTPEPYQDEKGEEHHYLIGEGDHDVTISTGPSFESQREEASDFLNVLISNLANLPVAPPQAAKLLAMAIQMKQLGPKGDQMAEIISPPDQGQNIPPQAQAAIAQAQGMAQQMKAELDKLLLEKQGKVVENEYRLRIEQMKQSTDIELQRLENELKIGIAEVQTKAQSQSERQAFVKDLWEQLRSHAHEIGLQASQQAHEREMAGRQAEIAAAQSAQDAAQSQAAAAANQNAGD